MHSSIKWLLIATTIVYVCRSETIHFTNSPAHLIGSKNFTSYKLLVKNSDPITIIEANKEINSDAQHATGYNPNDRLDANVNEQDYESAPTDDGDFGQKTLVVANGGFHQKERTPTVELREAIGLTIDPEPSEDDPSVRYNDDPNKPNHYHYGDSNNGGGVKKLVYSPVLLKKFVKEYTDKLKYADPGTKNAIKEIGEKINKNVNNESSDRDRDRDRDRDQDHRRPPSDFDKNGEGAEEKYNFNSFNDGFGDRRRRPSAGSTPNKDRDGWVTLDAVPWSSSTVSKWQGYGNKNDDRRPGSLGPPDRPFNRPNRPYNNNNNNYDADEDNFYRPKPLFNDDRPSTLSTWTRPQAMSRPGSQYAFSTFSGGGTDHADDFYDKPSGNNKPWSDDIITDHRPANFPRQPPKRADVYSEENDDRHRPSSHHSHPIEGNGEWVLISTTKGYQAPANRRQQGKRAMSFQQTAASLNAPHFVAHKGVKLTVLPALGSDSKNSTFSTDANSNPKPAMITSHGGLLEIEPSFQSVDDAVAAAAHADTAGITINSGSTTNTQVKNSIKKNTTNQVKKRKVLKGN